MKTTLDFPEPLFQQLQAQAALQGSSLKNLVVRLVERGLRESAHAAPGAAESDRWQDQLDPFTLSLLGIAAPEAGQAMPTLDDYRAHLARKVAGEASA